MNKQLNLTIAESPVLGYCQSYFRVILEKETYKNLIYVISNMEEMTFPEV